jgi:hypothetical protein
VVWKTGEVSGSAWAWPARIVSFGWFGAMLFI